MNHPRYRTTLALLLAAAMLLGSITPPVVRHAHADGGRSHDHHAVHKEDHSHSHHHGDSHSHGHPHNRSVESHSIAKSGSAQHFHLSLFGVELSLPYGGGSDSPFEEDGKDSHGPTLIHWLGSDMVVTDAKTVDASPDNLLVIASAGREGVSISHCSDTAQTMLASLPLCDAARCERSGVQQI